MSSLKRIICLANSWKLQERCIAGIDIDTGKWIRPVCDSLYPEDGKVPESVRLINGKEPQLLDILEIPLADTGNNFGFESENLSVLRGDWRLAGKALPYDLNNFCPETQYILHNSIRTVKPSYLQNLPEENRQTLQLIKSSEFSVTKVGDKWKGNITIANGQSLKNLTITDPFLFSQLDKGYTPPNTCFITVSLSMPWSPDDQEEEKPCWKLIAGCIPDLFPQIDQEMARVGWSIEQGRNFIEIRFGSGKISRRQLTFEELQQFLDHLKSLPNPYDEDSF
ncbi:MAG: dual OB domain-containing protein [Pseudanabaena sp.]|jgi:hypothetical protein|nr:hypothetical protein [Pseudanabaena sp. CoA8_M7]